MTTNSLKRGPLTNEDKEFIAQHFSNMSAEQIAAVRSRTPKMIEEYIKNNHSSEFQETAKNAEYNIQSSPVWKDIEKQFNKDELKMFLYHWGRIISQFGEDVYPTEEMQVIDTIKLEILMNRVLRQQQSCMEDVAALEALLAAERSVDISQQRRDEIFNLEKQIVSLRAAQESLNEDYRDMLQRKGNILKEMKATRDARIKILENSKHSYIGWMQRILSNKPLRHKLGVDMEKMRIAMMAEYNRLSEYHVYDDGIADQPFLTPENVIDDNDEVMRASRKEFEAAIESQDRENNGNGRE